MSELIDKRVIVTGVSGILGSAVVRALNEAGAKVVSFVRRRNGDDEAIVVDALDNFEEVEAAVAEAAARLGGLDALVNTAGAFAFHTVEQATGEDWLRLYRSNLLSAVATSRSALRYLSEGASIINIAATAALDARKGMGPYAASKAALMRFTESLADELRPRRIRVNSVVLDILDTPRNRHDMPGADYSQWMPPEAAAQVVLGVLSDPNRAASGSHLRV